MLHPYQKPLLHCLFPLSLSLSLLSPVCSTSAISGLFKTEGDFAALVTGMVREEEARLVQLKAFQRSFTIQAAKAKGIVQCRGTVDDEGSACSVAAGNRTIHEEEEATNVNGEVMTAGDSYGECFNSQHVGGCRTSLGKPLRMNLSPTCQAFISSSKGSCPPPAFPFPLPPPLLDTSPLGTHQV
jgi:hypothetical protein